MSTITLPNIRVGSDLQVRVRLKDGGVAIDWSTLTGIKAYLYSDEQRSMASRCTISVDEEDSTLLVCQYAASKPQYLGVNRIVVCATYMGETKNYDKPALNFVRWTADQEGEQITIDDPDVDVEIEVNDVSSSILDEAIRAAINAAEEAVDAKGQVLETEAEVEAAEALRVSAEESRVEAEEGRAEAEAARVDEEAVRVSAEDARVVAENARAAAEDLREGAEDDRAAAETARETAEAARVAAEALRVTAEGSRETAEAAREAQASADHTTAASDHTQAAADHTQAAADHTTAASDHTQVGADHTLAAADHVTAGEDHAQAQDDHEVMAGYDTRLGNVEGEVSQLEAEMGNPSTPELNIEQGAISSQNGTNTSANNRIRTNNYIVADGIGITTSGNKVYVFGYKSDGTYVGSSGAWITTNKDVYINGADKYRLGFAYSGDGQIGPSDFSSLGISILALHRSDFIKVVAQDLTETQKETARVNIGAIPESVVLNNAFKLAGAGETAVAVELTLMPNSKYKMAITNPSWGYSGSNTKLSLKPTGGSTIFYYTGQNEVPKEVYFSTGNSNKYTLTIRANAGVSFEYFFEELNDISTGIVMGIKPYVNFTRTSNGWNVTVNSSTKILKNWNSLSESPSGTFSFTDTDKLLVYRASTNTIEQIGTDNQRTDTVLLDYRASTQMFVGGLFYQYFVARRFADYDVYVTPYDFEFNENGQVSWSSLKAMEKNGNLRTFGAGSYIVNESNWLKINDNGNLALSSRSLVGSAEMILLGVQEGTYIGPLADYIEQQKLTSWYGDEYELDVKRNGEQLKNVKWTPKADVRTNEGLNPAGVEVTGVPYSSVKELEKFIGVDVSLHTFMTAVNNVHSLFYTEKVGEGNSQSAYGKTYHGVNCISYYGSVCSAFVDACLSLKNRFDSWLYQTSPKTFHILDPQDEQNLRVGDVISEDGHGAIITRIYRNLSGRITYVEVSEHNAPLATSKYGVYYLERLRVASNGVYCRRNNLGFVKYEPSPFVLADGEPLYRKGDLVFVDSASDRSFYLCETPNRDATWDNTSWSKIVAFATGSQINKGGYRQYGERLYRCKVTHTPTEFVPANWQYIPGVKEWTPYPYVYNDDIVTFAGDRAAFALGDDIYINFNKGSYTSMQIFNEENLVDTITLGEGFQVDVTAICNTPGLYKARLTDGTNYSKYTYFEVIDAIATASFENGICAMNYSSVYGKPIGAQIVERSGYPVCRFDLDGGSSITIDPQAGFYRQSWPYYKRAENYPKTVYARVVFAGEYGNVVSPMVELGEISAITGTLIYPDTPIDLGVLSGANTLILADGTQGERYDFSFTAGAGLSLSLRRTEGKMRWMEEYPTMVEGKTYFFSVVNGAVTWQVTE